MSCACEPSRHELDGGEQEPGGGARDSFLEVLGEAPVSAEPGEAALDDPSAWENLEALRGVGSLDDFEAPITLSIEGSLELFSPIAAIGEDVAQPREARSDRGENVRCAIAILDVGGMDDCRDQQATSVGEDVALAAHDFLARIIAARPTALRSLHALTVDDTCAGRGLATIGQRKVMRNRWLIVLHRPLSRQA